MKCALRLSVVALMLLAGQVQAEDTNIRHTSNAVPDTGSSKDDTRASTSASPSSTNSPATDRPRDPLELPADCNPADMPDNSIFGGRPLRPGEVIRCGSATWTGPPTELPKTSATGGALTNTAATQGHLRG